MADQNTLTEDDEAGLGGGEEEIVIVETKPGAQDDDEGDERLVQGDNDGDDGDETREQIRERRRREKQERKERREKAISRDKLELDFLRSRNDELERRLAGLEVRSSQADMAMLDRTFHETIAEIEAAEKVIAKATEAGNGDDVVQAMRYRDAAIAKAQQLQAARQQPQQQPVQTRQPPGLDDISLGFAKEFIQDNPWYDPAGKDEDSAVVLAIDNALVREGFDPRSEDYWDELRDRVKRRMPEKFKAERRATGGPAIGSGREHAPASTRKEVYISPERKQALIEAGVWDDPVLRNRYIKKYMEYDRLNNRS